MNDVQRLMEADFGRQLADWGVIVTHQSVSAVFDADSLSNDETITGVEITALVTTRETTTSPGTGEHYQDSMIRFTVRTSDLPELSSGQIRRFEYQGQVYDVTGIDLMGTGYVTTLYGRLRNTA